jgi:predicted nucleic-acid-binding Zn-ribbon protein
VRRWVMDPANRNLHCAHCGCEDFNHRRAQLNTALATFFGLDAHNQSADVYACRRCGRLEWFLAPDPAYLVATAPAAKGAPAVECPKCNMIVKKEVSRCTCGWSR